MYRKNARWELHKNVEWYFDQILVAVSHQRAVVQPFGFISQTIQVRRAKHAGHCWKSKNELIKYVLLWTPTHGHTNFVQTLKWWMMEMDVEKGSRGSRLSTWLDDDDDDTWFYTVLLIDIVYPCQFLWKEVYFLQTQRKNCPSILHPFWKLIVTCKVYLKVFRLPTRHSCKWREKITKPTW